jgi:inner membrane protein
MATPIGHLLLGYSVYLGGRRSETGKAGLWLCLLLAIAPDFDFIPGLLLGQPNLYHQGISHSLGASLVVSLAAAALIRGHDFWRNWGLLFFAYASHLTLDFFAPDGRPPYGLPLFWPITGNYYLAPQRLQILWGVHHHGSTTAPVTEWLGGVLQLRNLAAIGIELLVTLPMIFLARYASRLKNSADKGPSKHNNATAT